MKRILFVIVVLLLFCITFTTTFAQIKEDKTLATGNISYIFLSNDASGNSMDGYGVGLSIEFMASSNFSVGFGILFGRSQDSFVGDSANTVSDFSYYPMGLILKYIFVSKSSVQPYIGFNLGWHYSDIQTVITTQNDYSVLAASRNGVAIGIPVGMLMFISNTVYINAALTGTWLDNTPFKNSLNWGLSLGIGITY